MPKILLSDVPLIGDCLGTIPAVIALAQTVDKLVLVPHPARWDLAEMIPQKHGIQLGGLHSANIDYTIRVGPDDTEAYFYAHENKLHMTAAHHHFLGLPTPPAPVRPELEFPDIAVPRYDYILSPFSRSLPEEQLWPAWKWAQLVGMLPKKKFAFFGNPQYDIPGQSLVWHMLMVHKNVQPEFGRPLAELANIMQKSGPCISVTNGISHLSFALGTGNILLFGQDTPWGKNPDATIIQGLVPDISVEQVLAAFTE